MTVVGSHHGPSAEALKLTLVLCAVAISTRASASAADLIVVIATWIRTYSNVRKQSRLNGRMTLSAVLLRDGAIIQRLGITH